MIAAVMGKILWVDLASGITREEALPDAIYEHLLSGMGLAAYVLYRTIPPGADPLGPENVLGFVSGLLTCTGCLMAGRWMAVAKSPLTGTWGEANCGGTLAPAIKQCGYDGIFFTGQSPKPVYLFVDEGRVELRDAAHLWGKDTRETESLLQEEVGGRKPAVACIGPAGENRSLISGIANDQGRMAARSGLGAVMGAKRLKAVALRGSQRPTAADPEEVKRLSRAFEHSTRVNLPFLTGLLIQKLAVLLRVLPLQLRQDGLLFKILLSRWGTIGTNRFALETGDSPVKNWSGTHLDYSTRLSAAIDPERIQARERRKYRCYSCSIACGGICTLPEREGDTHKPEFETVTALGPLLGVTDLDRIFELNELLNRAGMDAISAGGTVAFAIECYEQGLLTSRDMGGLELRWGDVDAVGALIEKMVRREGIGDLLADGARAAAARLGAGSENSAVHAGGQELAMHDPRNDPGFALHAVVEPSPGRHTVGAYMYYEMFQLWTRVPGLPRPRPRFYPKGIKYHAGCEQAAWAAACSRFSAALNGAGVCLFGGLAGVNRLPFFEWINAVTGWQRTPAEIMQMGQNIQDLRQLFNARQGAPLRAAINPRALGLPPQKRGPNRGRSVPLEELVPLYWAEMGWDPQTGLPSRRVLDLLGLDD